VKIVLFSSLIAAIAQSQGLAGTPEFQFELDGTGSGHRGPFAQPAGIPADAEGIAAATPDTTDKWIFVEERS
jgi:hypothetical protein